MLSDHLKLSVISAAYSDDPRQAVTRAAAAGFVGIQFEAISSSLDLTTLANTGRREFRHLIESKGLQMVGLRTGLGPKGFSIGADIDRLMSRLDSAMSATAGLQLSLLCVDLGPLPAPASAPKPAAPLTPLETGLIILPQPPAPPAEPALQPPPEPAFISQVDNALAELGGRADRYSVTIAFRSDLAGFAALDRAITQAACPWFGVDLDPVSILRDRWPVDEIFSRLGHHIRHVRGRDATVGADKRTQPASIGRGSTQWNELLGLLDDAGYRGWITIDPIELMDRPGAAAAAAKFLRE